MFSLLSGIFISQAVALAKSEPIIFIPFGTGINQLGITPEELQTQKEIPQSFFIDNNKSIYILDSVKKRIAIYGNTGTYSSSIPLEFINNPKDIMIHNNNIYVLAEKDSSAVIYTLSPQGTIIVENWLPSAIKGFEANFLKVTKSNNIGVTTSKYDEYELNNDGMATKTSDGITSPYSDKVLKGVLGSDKQMHLRSVDGNIDLALDIKAFPAGAEIVGNDISGSVYVMVGDMADTSKVIVESTIRKIDKNGKQIGVVRLPLEKCVNFPQKAIDVKDNGDIYFMAIVNRGIEIEKLNTDKTYKSTILDDQAKQKAKESTVGIKEPVTVSPMVTTNSRNTTLERAMNSSYRFTWMYSASNNINPNPSTITRPDFLSSYNWKTGIPYCWGGYDTLDRSSSTGWTNFQDAINKRKFAGNVATPASGWQSGTAGVDCSGYVGSAVGYGSIKPGTWTLNADTHAHTLSERGQMDIYINPAVHVLFFNSALSDGTGISAFESTTFGDDKSQQTIRSYNWLSSNNYSLRSWW